jgi:hypothetical protein
MTDSPRKDTKAVLVTTLAFIVAAIGAFVFFPFLRNFLYILGLAIAGVFILIKFGRGHAGLVLLFLVAICAGIFFLYRAGMRSIAVETQFQDISRSLKVASVAKDGEDIDSELAKLSVLRKNALYTSKHEEKAQRIIDGNDLVYFRYSIHGYQEKGNISELEKRFETFKQLFSGSRLEGDFSGYIDKEKKRLAALKAEEEKRQAAAREKKQADEIMAATEYDSAFELAKRFSSEHPRSSYLPAIQERLEKLNLEKLKSLQRIANE